MGLVPGDRLLVIVIVIGDDISMVAHNALFEALVMEHEHRDHCGVHEEEAHGPRDDPADLQLADYGLVVSVENRDACTERVRDQERHEEQVDLPLFLVERVAEKLVEHVTHVQEIYH